jgi:hypothetical protein
MVRKRVSRGGACFIYCEAVDPAYESVCQYSSCGSQNHEVDVSDLARDRLGIF